MKKLAIVGYGRMGKLLDRLAPDHDFEVCSRIDPALGTSLQDASLAYADVCIEFSTPTVAWNNISQLIQLQKPVVCGTTGWLDHLPELHALAASQSLSVVYGSNFSVGMNLFFEIVSHTATLMSTQAQYDAYGLELHHNRKKDSPSGTARKLSDIILSRGTKTTAQFDRLNRQPLPEEFHFASVRAGDIPGTHLIGFDSVADSIELKHTARNREGFALGALLAASWLLSHPGIHEFSSIFKDLHR